MDETRLWKIVGSNSQELNVERIQNVKETETENQLEEVITRCPNLLMKDLKLIGRQTDTAGGPLDLLGVDGDGQLVVFELKRGTLTREAVAQIVDYSSYLASLEPKELSEHISPRSGNLGIEKIENFLIWYQEQFGRNFTEVQRPRMVLVGLGADEKTKRMVSFMSEGDLDISLITFHGFRKGDEVFLARQVDVQSRPQLPSTIYTKKSNLEKLKHNVQELRLEEYYYNIASFFRNQFPAAYEWPNPGGYSYSLPELTDTGNQSNRVYVALYVYQGKPGCVQIYLHERALKAASSSLSDFKDSIHNSMIPKKDGSCEIWVKSNSDWKKIKVHFGKLCPAILEGWKRTREQQSKDEFEATESISDSEDQSEA
ncbi:MAG TPA: endonuclease NucS domain-containing protein [Anaerolineae bacterium]|nr:endonuclease NucS domain-containing protein [Anaerolineae bacterium]